MNVIFTAIIIASLAVITVAEPDKLLSVMMGGAERSLQTAFSLFCIYAVWMGLSRLAEKSGLSRGAARALKPLTKRVFRTQNERANEMIAMNVACNLLGIGGAATPFAVKAVQELENDKNGFAQKLLFIINATSIQLLPSTVIALRTSAGSAAAADIFLPSLICTVFSTLTAVALFLLTTRIRRRKR